MRRIIFGLLGLLGLAFAAAPASAVSCGGEEFLIFARTSIVFEAGLTSLTGNIINVNPTGTIKLGSKNIITGNVSANRVIVSEGASVVGTCTGTVVELQGTGANKGKCSTVVVTPFTPPAECTATFPPATLFPQATFPAVCVPNTAVVVAAGDDDTLAPGCYKSIRINAGGTLTLTPGGEYFVTGETRLLNGATLIGGTGQPDAPPTLNLKGILITEANITLNNLLVQSQNTSGQAINIFNKSMIEDTVLVTLGNLHPHTGGQLRGTTELVADRFLDIQPITNVPPPPVGICACPANFPNFAIENVPPDQWTAPTALARSCVK